MSLLDLPNDLCEKCRLHETCRSPFMESSGSENPRVLAIGEAPGAEEDKEDIPFVGKSGSYLRKALTAAGFDITGDVRFTNVVRCRPPNNVISKAAVSCCKDNVLLEIEHYDPELVLLLGNVPLSLLGESGITAWNGVVIQRHGRTYIPLFHPAYLLRDSSPLDDWLRGMLEGYELLGDTTESVDDDAEYIFPKSVDAVLSMVNELAQYDRFSYDTETSTLDAFGQESRIIAFSFGVPTGMAWAVPLDHPGSYFTRTEREYVTDYIRNVLPDGNVVGHNIKFDQIHTRKHLGIEFDAAGDTMLLSHLIDSKRGIHSLKRLAGLHLGMYGYDDELEEYKKVHSEANPRRGGSYAAIPLEVLLPYAAMDAHATIMLEEQLLSKLSDKQKALYEDHVMPASNALARVEYNGFNIDSYMAARYLTIYKIRRAEMYEEILEDAKVRRMIQRVQRKRDLEIMRDMLSISSTDAFSKKSFVVDSKFIVYKGKRDLRRKKRKRMRKVYRFNPNSDVQVANLLYKSYKIPVPGRTNTGLPSVKASLLRPYRERYPIVDDIRYYKLLYKMVSTYLGPAANGSWGAERARGDFNLHGTITGRLSSTSPNLQNIPTPEKEPDTLLEILPVKNIFTHSWGEGNGVLMSADYANMELRVTASMAKCDAMMDVFRSGQDIHTMVAAMVSGIPYEDINRSTRYIYKWTNWTLLYGGDAHTLHNLYDIPMDEAQDAVVSYYDKFPEVLDFQERCATFAEDAGYIESPFGRRAHLPYINDRDWGRKSKARRTALNMPAQSASGDITIMALIIIDDLLYRNMCRTMIVNTVHDSIVLDVPNDEIDEVAMHCVYAMEYIKELALSYFPGVDFTWLTAPLRADIEIGSHYGAEEPYEVDREKIAELACY